VQLSRKTEINMKKASKYFGLVAVATSMFVLSACGDSEKPAAAPAAPAPAAAVEPVDTNAVSNAAGAMGTMKPNADKATSKPATKKKPAGSGKKPST
jgi:hypothetical protein